MKKYFVKATYVSFERQRESLHTKQAKPPSKDYSTGLV